MSALHEEATAHLVDGDQIRELLRPAVSATGPLHHVARCTDGVRDLALDALDDVLPFDPDAHGGQLDRGTLTLADQQLSLTATQLDRRLAPARSGGLIRLVAQGDPGAFYCNSIIPGAHLVGAVLTSTPARRGEHPRGHPEVGRGDQALSGLTSELRRMIMLGSQDPGGYEHPESPEPRTEPRTVHASGDPRHRLAPLLRAALSPDDVHYLAYYHRGEARCSFDVLADRELAPFFAVIEVAARRRFYQEFGTEFGEIAGELGRIVYPLVGAPLTRVVLDVEQGALYYLRIRGGEYLVGVTLNQWRVSHADARIDRLADECRGVSEEAPRS